MTSTISAQGDVVQIACFREKRLCIATDAISKILDQAGPRPVSIVSINGPMRSGKSYIINHLLRYLFELTYPSGDWFNYKLNNEFRWQNSAERLTTGICMWSKPIIVKRNGQEIAILLIDTQGSFDNKTTNHENTLIFTLSCLLSSVLIYNVPKQLSEDVFDFLQMFIGYANINQGSEPLKSNPKLVFLVRDWHSPKSYEFGYHDKKTQPGSKNFMKEQLNVTDGMIPEVRSRRKQILSSFQDIGCCLSPYPGNDLAYDDKAEKLDPLFTATIKDFVPRIIDPRNIITKKFGGKEIDCEYFKQYVEKLANYFNNNELPEVKSINDLTAEVHNQFAYSTALKFYRDEMDKVMGNSNGLEDKQFKDFHTKNKKEAIEIFIKTKRLEHDELQRRYSKNLEDSIQQAFDSYQQINYSKCATKELQKKQRQLEEEMKRKAWEEEEKRRQLEEEMNRMAWEEEENRRQLEEKMNRMTREAGEKQRQLEEENNRKAKEAEEKQEALKFYRDEMERVMGNSNGLEDKQFKEFHTKNKKEAIEKFTKTKRLEHEVENLEGSIQQAFDSYQLKMSMDISEKKQRQLEEEIKKAREEAEKQKAYSTALNFYRDEMDKVMGNSNGLDDKKFIESHTKYKGEAIEKFKKTGQPVHEVTNLGNIIQKAFDDTYKLKMDVASQKRISEKYRRQLESTEDKGNCLIL